MQLDMWTDFAGQPAGALPEHLAQRGREAMAALRSRTCPGGNLLGWMDLPDISPDDLAAIEAEAHRLQALCDLVVVVGVGGSYVGAKSALDFILSPHYNQLAKDTPDILFAGDHLDGDSLRDILELCAGREVGICFVSKSGTTAEPALAFRSLESRLRDQYGEAAAQRILCISGQGPLWRYAEEQGYARLPVPEDVGGRFSVLSAVGLLPMALAGVNIRAVLEGAKRARAVCLGSDDPLPPPAQYAVWRHAQFQLGRPVEIMAMGAPALGAFGDWLRQLFAESEGKAGGGILPLPAAYTADLHSLGQFIQQGNPVVFETLLSVERGRQDCRVAPGGDFDGLSRLVGQPLDTLSALCMEAVSEAHREAGVPVLRLVIPERSASVYGQLVFFFETACAVSALMAGVNPFDQPGVEDYKRHMTRLFNQLKTNGTAEATPYYK